MKQKITVITYLSYFLWSVIYAQNIGVGTTRPHPKAKLEISDSTRVFLPPRMTTFQRDTMTNLPMGGIIFNVTTRCLEYWNGRRWISLCSSSCMELPVPEVNADVITACEGEAVTLSVTDSGYTYVWITSQGQQIIGTTLSLNPIGASDTGIYVVYAYDSLTQCSSSDTMIYVKIGTLSCSQPNSWTALPAPPAGITPRENQVVIALNGKIYMGLGINQSLNQYLKDWWEYDPCSNGTWRRLPDFPGNPRHLASVFSINGKIYVGGGQGAGFSFYGDMYRYDPNTNTWTPIAALPSPRRGAPGASDGNYGYVICGQTGINSYTDEILRYNPTNNTWTVLTHYPAGGRGSPFVFRLNGKLYIGTGTSLTNCTTNEFYEYDIATNAWTAKTPYPTLLTEGWGIADAVNSRGYVIGGSPVCWTFIAQYYYYSPTTDSWTPMPVFPGGNRNDLRGEVINGKLYCGFGFGGNNLTYINDWWLYCP